MTTLLKRPEHFATFGPSILARQTRGQMRGSQIPCDRHEARKMLREKCPLEPGVYGWLDKNRQLVYVGKSKCLRKRLLSYFAKTPADKKAFRIRQHSHSLVWEPISCELLALIREQELIYRWRPEFNSQGQPTRTQPAFVCVGGAPVHNARMARRLSPQAEKAFGPISGTNRLQSAIESLNQVFQLRDCPDRTSFEFNNQLLLFGERETAQCIRHELGSCPGPCAGHCSATQYQSNVQQMLNFLTGDNIEILGDLEQRMHRAAQNTSFERAAIIRDCWQNLSWLNRRLEGLRKAHKQLNGVLEVEARRNRMAWVILKGGRIVSTVKKPSDPNKAGEVKDSVEKAARQAIELPTNILEMNLQLIVISWLRKNPEMRQQLIPFGEAIEQLCGLFRHNLAVSA